MQRPSHRPATKSKTPADPAPGAPEIYGAAALDYQDYLKIPQLLQLQKPQSSPPHHDEMLFIIIHQAYELWFKLLIHEMERVLLHLRGRDASEALHGASRIVEVTKLLVRQIHLLETMRPVDFLQFRDHLKPASGFQSVQFREIEFLAGLKEPAYLKFFQNRPALARQLQERLDGSDLAKEFYAFVAGGRTKGAPTYDAEDPATWDPLWKVLVPLYARPESDPTLYRLCEKLIEFDEHFSLWRHHHVNVVERIIGLKRGTGGSSGVAYLKTTTTKRCFPYLWELRTRLEAPR